MSEKEKNNSPVEENIFQKEIARLPEELKEKLLAKEKVFAPVVAAIKEKVEEKSMGFFINPEVEIQNGQPVPNFDKLTLNFLFDDFERPIQFFDAKLLLQEKFDELLVEEKKKDEYGQEFVEYYLKADKDIKFFGTSIALLRENCFDAVYDDMKKLGSSFVYEDNRGFIGALKTIDIHRNMLLQKFEKYVVVYAGAGSWLRGEKSNDFDVFVVVDDTDVKRMPRMQVKDQLTRIIWQMAREVAQLTGVHIHAQVYLLTDFWDALKDAHPVMFTFLRDGVPFYDRGLYSAWKELLKLGKIRPTPEAIDMHMNVGNQLIDRAKKTFSDIVMNDVYYSVLNPAQAILMLKGFNPTTPKETIKMFRDVLLAKEKSVSEKDVQILEETVQKFKEIEHNRETEVKGKDVDKMLKEAEGFLKNIKKMFEEITEERTKESIVSSYNELLTQVRTLPGYAEISEKEIFSKFELEYVKSGKLPSFVKGALKDIVKSKADYEVGKITVTEVNKVLKEIRTVLSEIKTYRDKNMLSEISKKKLYLQYGENKNAELLQYSGTIYLNDLASENVFEFDGTSFAKSKTKKEELADTANIESLKLSDSLLSKVKEILKVDELSL